MQRSCLKLSSHAFRGGDGDHRIYHFLCTLNKKGHSLVTWLSEVLLVIRTVHPCFNLLLLSLLQARVHVKLRWLACTLDSPASPRPRREYATDTTHATGPSCQIWISRYEKHVVVAISLREHIVTIVMLFKLMSQFAKPVPI